MVAWLWGRASLAHLGSIGFDPVGGSVS